MISTLKETQLVSFDRSNNYSAIDVKIDNSSLDEKPTFKMPGLFFPFKMDWELLYCLCFKLHRTNKGFNFIGGSSNEIKPFVRCTNFVCSPIILCL